MSEKAVLVGIGLAFLAGLALAIWLLMQGGLLYGTDNLPGGITSGDI